MKRNPRRGRGAVQVEFRECVHVIGASSGVIY